MSTIRQSLSSRFRQFTSFRSSQSTDKMGLVNFPSERCDLALTRLDELESDRLVNAKFPLNNQKGEGSSSITKSQQNRKANRYTDIVSYDHSLLSGDYLNASLIPTLSKQGRAYIASQAPLPHTFSTFYEKVIQTNTKLIVNLTPFEERGKLKADPYWPLQHDEQLNISQSHSTLTSKDAEIGSNDLKYIIRQSKKPTLLDKTLQATIYPLSIMEQSDQRRSINLSILHITSWVDFGKYPDHIFEQVLTMIEDQNRQAQDDAEPLSPIWVHCSAGVGRSGTVIASMLAQDIGKGENIKDILKLSTTTSSPAQIMEASMEGASKLIDYERTFRPRMVQTGEQFEMVAAVVAKEIQKQEKLN